MKKIVIAILAIVILVFTTGCGETNEEVAESKDPIGYIIIMHEDGEEHAEIYKAQCNEGILFAWTMDGDEIVTTEGTIVLYDGGMDFNYGSTK